MDAKDLIKAKVDIVDIIGGYVTLKKAGTNFKALCPFHHEKSPSFMASQERQSFHCFGCGEGGDVFSFVQKMEHCDFVEAMKILAPKAGVKIEDIIKTDKQYSKKERLIEINERAAKLFHQILLQTNQAIVAREYLKKRGLTELTIDTWSLGFAPAGWDTALKGLKSKGYTETEIIEAGLAVKNEKGRVYDRFRNRIMFPIRDAQGHIVGFTARQMDPNEKGGKYINTPQTLIYNKSEVMYGLDQAKGAIKKADFVIIVEGNMDVIMSHQAGLKNAVGVSGTALTELQISQLKRFTQNLYFCFDADAAGAIAALRGLDVALNQEMSIKAIILPSQFNGITVKDPADLVSINPDAWQKAVDDAIPMMQSLLDSVARSNALSTDAGKRKSVNFIVEHLLKIKNPVEQEHWRGIISQKLGVSEGVLGEMMSRADSKIIKTKPLPVSLSKTQAVKSRPDLLIENVYGLLLKGPENLTFALEKIKVDEVKDESLRQLVKSLFLYYNQAQSFEYKDFVTSLGENTPIVSLNNLLALRADALFADFSEVQIRDEIIQSVKFLHLYNIKEELRRVQSQIAEAEKAGDQARIQELMRLSASLGELLQN